MPVSYVFTLNAVYLMTHISKLRYVLLCDVYLSCLILIHV